MQQSLCLRNLLIFCMIIARTSSRGDYWSEEFDQDKNCVQEKKIVELKAQVLKEASLIVPYQILLLFQDV